MIVDIILAVLLAGAFVICIVLYRNNVEYNRHTAEATKNADRLQLELESYKASAEQIRRNETESAQIRLNDLRNSYESQILQLKESHASQTNEMRKSYESQIGELKITHQAQLEHEREMLGEKFKALAADVLQANSTVLDRNSRISLEAVLSPMKTNLEEFIKSYRDTCDVDKKDRMSLLAEIQNLHKLNSEVSRETGRLATALKGNTGVQGRWGEMVLANILEHSGLQEGRWFVTQESTTPWSQ